MIRFWMHLHSLVSPERRCRPAVYVLHMSGLQTSLQENTPHSMTHLSHILRKHLLWKVNVSCGKAQLICLK